MKVLMLIFAVHNIIMLHIGVIKYWWVDRTTELKLLQLVNRVTSFVAVDGRLATAAAV